MAQNIRQAIEQAQIEHSQSPISRFVTVSIGLAATVPDHSLSPASLIETADRALYTAKSNGRNQVYSLEVV